MSNLPKRHELSKISLNFAEKREMSVDYDDKHEDSWEKDEERYHIIWIYLEIDDCSDAHISLKVKKWDNYGCEFIAEFYGACYGRENEALIAEIFSGEIHGEKELRERLKKLASHRKEILDICYS